MATFRILSNYVVITIDWNTDAYNRFTDWLSTQNMLPYFMSMDPSTHADNYFFADCDVEKVEKWLMENGVERI